MHDNPSEGQCEGSQRSKDLVLLLLLHPARQETHVPSLNLTNCLLIQKERDTTA